jgi:hypothetical protein
MTTEYYIYFVIKTKFGFLTYQFGEDMVGWNGLISYTKMSRFFKYLLTAIYASYTGQFLDSDTEVDSEWLDDVTDDIDECFVKLNQDDIVDIANLKASLCKFDDIYEIKDQEKYREKKKELEGLYLKIYDKYYDEDSFEFKNEYGEVKNLREYIANAR